LKVSGSSSEAQIGQRRVGAHSTHESRQPTLDIAWTAVYVMAIGVSISLWFIALRSPLWLDETISFWQINNNLSGVSARQGLSFAAYSYILWFCTKILGTSELALRIPSILAMLGSVCLLYLAARRLFSRDIAIVAVIIFCLHPLVVFASIDVRAYAFGALAVNASILSMARLRYNNSNWSAVWFGVLAATIVYFQFLFIVILPVLIAYFLTNEFASPRIFRRQLSCALAGFSLAFLPVVPGLRYMFRTASVHVFDDAPGLTDLLETLAPRGVLFALVGTTLVAVIVVATTRKVNRHVMIERRSIFLCAALALSPILILYGVSVGTSIHVFVPRYRLIAVPGIALCWALALSWFDRPMRMLFCVGVLAITAYFQISSPFSGQHGYTWKYALVAVEKNASADSAPVLICSDLPESDHLDAPLVSAQDSTYFAPLTYYKLSVPVVPLPRSLNNDAIQVGSRFLEDASKRHQRFLAMAFTPSYKTLAWLAQHASGAYDVRILGVFDDVKVLEFVPRT